MRKRHEDVACLSSCSVTLISLTLVVSGLGLGGYVCAMVSNGLPSYFTLSYIFVDVGLLRYPWAS